LRRSVPETGERNQSSPGRYAGQDNGWIALYMNPRLIQFFEELNTSISADHRAWYHGGI
jgi:hypothetical protein